MLTAGLSGDHNEADIVYFLATKSTFRLLAQALCKIGHADPQINRAGHLPPFQWYRLTQALYCSSRYERMSEKRSGQGTSGVQRRDMTCSLCMVG